MPNTIMYKTIALVLISIVWSNAVNIPLEEFIDKLACSRSETDLGCVIIASVPDAKVKGSFNFKLGTEVGKLVLQLHVHLWGDEMSKM